LIFSSFVDYGNFIFSGSQFDLYFAIRKLIFSQRPF